MKRIFLFAAANVAVLAVLYVVLNILADVIVLFVTPRRRLPPAEVQGRATW